MNLFSFNQLLGTLICAYLLFPALSVVSAFDFSTGFTRARQAKEVVELSDSISIFFFSIFSLCKKGRRRHFVHPDAGFSCSWKNPNEILNDSHCLPEKTIFARVKGEKQGSPEESSSPVKAKIKIFESKAEESLAPPTTLPRRRGVRRSASEAEMSPAPQTKRASIESKEGPVTKKAIPKGNHLLNCQKTCV